MNHHELEKIIEKHDLKDKPWAMMALEEAYGVDMDELVNKSDVLKILQDSRGYAENVICEIIEEIKELPKIEK